jgi:hypothetical protein
MRLSGVAEQGYTMLYGKYQLIKSLAEMVCKTAQQLLEKEGPT